MIIRVEQHVDLYGDVIDWLTIGRKREARTRPIYETLRAVRDTFTRCSHHVDETFKATKQRSNKAAKQQSKAQKRQHRNICIVVGHQRLVIMVCHWDTLTSCYKSYFKRNKIINEEEFNKASKERRDELSKIFHNNEEEKVRFQTQIDRLPIPEYIRESLMKPDHDRAYKGESVEERRFSKRLKSKPAITYPP